jgi:hypothetical protein
VTFGQFQQVQGKPLGAAGHRLPAELGDRVPQALRDRPAVGAGGVWIAVQEGVEAVVSHDQCVHRVDGLQGRGPVASHLPGNLAGHLADDVPVATQRMHPFLAFGGDGKDLDPAADQDV